MNGQNSARHKQALGNSSALIAMLAGGIALAAPAGAWAQAATNAQTGGAQAVRATTQNDTPAEEIVVTATRRSEALNRVPIAVTAVPGRTLENLHVANFPDLPALVPGASFVATKGQSTANVQIRGQTTTNDAPGLEVPVAIFQDDIYYGTLASFDADFFDVQQVAVLRGPQGTTFGRNVVGGAIQITDNMPEIGVTSGAINATVDTFSRYGSAGFEGNGYFNLPINSSAAARIAYSVHDVDGYMHNAVTGNNLSDQKSFAVRPSLRVNLSDDLLFTGFVQYNHENMFASGYQLFGAGSEVASLKAQSDDPWVVHQDVDGVTQRDIWAGQARFDWTMGLGTLTSLTSYRTLDSRYVDDGDNGPKPMNDPSINQSNEHAFSQEVRLTSPSGQRLEYVAGLYYSSEDLRKAITFGFNGTDPTTTLSLFTGGTLQDAVVTGDVNVETIAPFAEGKFHFTDQLALTLGARYTSESKNGFTDHSALTGFYGAPYHVNFDHTWDAFTPRGILEWTPAHNLLFYGSVSTGFKGGGWTLTATNAARAVNPLAPERSTSYELGAKLQLFDHHLSLNIAAYQADTSNVQVRTLINGVLQDSNAAEQRVRGVELETIWHPTPSLDIGVNYAYTDAHYTSFPDCTSGGFDCSGNEVPFVHPNDTHLFVDYRFDLGSGALLTAHADVHWADETQVSPVNYNHVGGMYVARPNTDVPGILNASLTYRPSSAPWRLQFWAKNITNQWYMAAPSNYYFYHLTKAEYLALAATPWLRDVERGTLNPPRQIGFTLSYDF
jgi:iron complex outermembrane receptor protein